jgi:transcriptional regulator with XRE-family HTH domain
MGVTDVGRQDTEDAGAVLRRLRHTGGRRVSQRALATLLGTSRARIARLELDGAPPLTDEQLDRLEKAGDTVRPPFSRTEIEELRAAMRATGTGVVAQTDQAVKDIAVRVAQIFAPPRSPTSEPGHRPGHEQAAGAAMPTRPSGPLFLTTMRQIAEAAHDDIRRLAACLPAGRPSEPDAEPDLVLTHFGGRNLVEEAEEPERFRDAIIEVLRKGATVEYLIAPSGADTSRDLVPLVPVMIYYLGHGGPRYRVHLIPEASHPLAYGMCVAGDRGLLIARGEGDKAIAARAADDRDVAALRDMLRPYWKDSDPIIEELGRRTTRTVTGRAAPLAEPLRFDRVLTSVEVEKGPRRLAKNGLSILNIPVAIQAWKGRAAELCTARRIPEELLGYLQSRAWDLADHGIGALPDVIGREYSGSQETTDALAELSEYAQNVKDRQAAWADQLSRYDFWDACPKSALIQFMSTGELPCDEMPPTCGYAADPYDIEIIITRLITRLRTNRYYHLALVDELPFSRWFYLEVKASHVLAQVFDTHPGADQTARSCDDDMLSAHIDCAPIAEAFAGWFDEQILKTATSPPWHDHHRVADWIEKRLEEARRSWLAHKCFTGRPLPETDQSPNVAVGPVQDACPALVELVERARVETDREWLADGEGVSLAYLGVQDVVVAVEGEDGDLSFGFEV